MSEDFFKPTQQLLEGLISTPSMSEKLLLRPPFRFIHDIITSLSKQYSPEGYFFNVNDEISEDLREGDKIDGKEMKLKYLIELFKVVEKWSGRTIDADPKKVASGKECEKTNIFLQIVGSIVLDRKRTKMHASIPGEISSSDVTPSTAPPAATPPSTAPPAATSPSTPSSKKRSPSPQKTSQKYKRTK